MAGEPNPSGGTNGDILWSSFAPFWSDLRAASPLFLLMGGYALTLKQRWLLEDSNVQVLIHPNQWKDQTPRTSRDLDFIVSPEAIGSREVQQRAHAALQKHGYRVVPKRLRWQFEKRTDEGNRIKLDIQAFAQLKDRTDIKQKDIRIKPYPSMKDVGVHGRLNPDVPGGHVTPPVVHPGGVPVALMNMYAHLMMKLTAIHDRWERSLDLTKTAEKRALKASQSYKHAHDTCMIVAMLTDEDRASLLAIRECVGSDPKPLVSATYVHRYFGDESSQMMKYLSEKWHPAHLQQIRALLMDWFPSQEKG